MRVPGNVPREPVYEVHQINWCGQEIIVRWCPKWLGGDTAHLEIVTPDRSPHPISQTGYRSYFCPRELVDEVGGLLATHAPDAARLVDLCSGVGLFAGTVGEGRQVVGVERSAAAVAAASATTPG